MENTQTTKKVNFLTIGATSLAVATILSVTVPATVAFADEQSSTKTSASGGSLWDMIGELTGEEGVSSIDDTEANLPEFTYTKSTESYDVLYDRLSPDDKVTFDAIVAEGQLTPAEALDILQTRDGASVQPRWKVSVLKAAIKYGAKLVGYKISEKGLASFTDYLFGWSGSMEKRLSDGFVKFFGVNRTVANWTAKTVMFVVF